MNHAKHTFFWETQQDSEYTPHKSVPMHYVMVLLPTQELIQHNLFKYDDVYLVLLSCYHGKHVNFRYQNYVDVKIC